MKKHGFTLAEVLITLAIVGVVAAMTIPTLIAKINSIVTDNQIKVFNAKIIKGMNLTKTAGDLNNTYSSTYDFLTNGLGKNLKMVKICDKDHIRDCIPYDKIKYNKNNKEETIDVADLKTAGDLQIENVSGTNYVDTAAFVLADGTPVIVTYDLNCIDDPDKADTAINKCLAGIYDLNGTRKPNKYGESTSTVDGKTVTTHNSDLQPFNGARIANSVLATINGVKIMTKIAVPTPMTYSECEANKSKYGINECCTNSSCQSEGDYWAGAVKMCKDQGYRLPTNDELAKIASEFYGVTVGATETINNKYRINSRIPTSVFPGYSYSSSISNLNLWSNLEYDGSDAYWRSNAYRFTSYGAIPRRYSDAEVICVK